MDQESYEERDAAFDAVEATLTAEQKQIKELEEKTRELYAKMENVRRRTEADVANAHKFAIEKFVKELLAVLDAFDQGLSSLGANQAGSEGLSLAVKLLLDTMKKFGVEEVDPKGQVFDPQLHEALSIQATAEVPPNQVLVVFQKGYTLRGRLMRPARVVVSKALEN